MKTWAWRLMVKLETQPHTKLVFKLEVELKSRTELAAGAEPRIWTTIRADKSRVLSITSRGDRTRKPGGNNPNSQMGPAKKAKI